MKANRVIISLAAVIVSSAAMAKEMTLVEARVSIAQAIADVSQVTSTMKALSAADQVAYLGSINQAVSKMPGSSESKAAAFVNVNKAALRGARKGNLKPLIAEVFATVPPEALAVISERYAADLFNRSSASTMSDEKYVAMVQDVLKTIDSRLDSSDNADVRMTFAIVMFMRACNNTIKGLDEKLIANLPESSRDVAKKDWIPGALKGSYDTMLGAADAGVMPDVTVVIKVAGPQIADSLLAALSSDAFTVTVVENEGSVISGGAQILELGNAIPLPRDYDD
jgi:hypothetical protein